MLTPWGTLKAHPLNEARQLAVQLNLRIAPPRRLFVAELPTADYHTMLTMLTDRVGSTLGVWPTDLVSLPGMYLYCGTAFDPRWKLPPDPIL